MKIAAFEVKDYELEDFARGAEEFGLDIGLHTGKLDEDSLPFCEGCEGVITLGFSILDEKLIRRLADMGIRYIATRTVGYNHIDVAAAKKYEIRVSNVSYAPYNVADFTVMLILMLLRKAKISVCRALVNDFSLDGMCGREMRNLTVGIVGAGNIGRAVAQDLSGFGCRLLAYDPYVSPKTLPSAQFVPFDELLAQSDVVTLHMPLTAENKHMFNAEEFAKMKKGALLVNTARGGLINTQALIEALETERLGGAAIDTIEDDEQICHVDLRARVVDRRDLFYLKQFPNVIFTSHYAYFTEEAVSSMVRCALESISAFRDGKRAPYEIG